MMAQLHISYRLAEKSKQEILLFKKSGLAVSAAKYLA
ncbi:MAG: hypothetical protein Ct9H300mP17_16560 [Candidatus Nitrosopelagicus sp.]|nr:MAG: hypothetical protein Ct9H300mP17_16560 [Candidatus Nitrosopelagicus sp.]